MQDKAEQYDKPASTGEKWPQGLVLKTTAGHNNSLE